MDKKELDERVKAIFVVYGGQTGLFEENEGEYIKDLIRDVIAAVTPENPSIKKGGNADQMNAEITGFKNATDKIEQNTKELIG